MLRSTKSMMGYKLEASDGSIGQVEDFLFDEAHWTARWLVADTGDWLPKRRVLISPISLGEPDWRSQMFPVRLTKSEIENAPAFSADKPVSRDYERMLFNHFTWPYYWEGTGVWGGALVPEPLFRSQEKSPEIENRPEDEQEEILRSAEEVIDYHIQAQDGEIGHVEDFIMDDQPWSLRYMVVDTRNWLPGRKVLVAPDWVDAIRWSDRTVSVKLSRAEVEESPEYKPFAPINREYEERLYDYYGRPTYWRS